jgi:DNA-binding transcriptional LysR family regulator
MVIVTLHGNCNFAPQPLHLRMTFDLRQLSAFASVASTGSLGRSAEMLHITQPGLSRTIKRLEEKIGAELFERHSKGMQLTAIGSALLPHALLLLREAEHTEEDIRELRGLAKGTIRVGAVASIASYVLPIAVGKVLQRWPGLQVQVLEGVWDRLTDALTTHEIDLALGVDAPDSDDIVAIRDCCWQDSSFIVAAAAHPLRTPAARLQDTLAVPWTMPPRGTGPYELMEQTFSANGLAMPPITVETRSVTVMKSLVIHAGFLSYLPAPMYQQERNAGVVDALPITGAMAQRTLTAFRRRHGILPAPAAKLLDQLRTGTMPP